MLVDRYDAVLFDLDGVLYRGGRPVEHASDAVARLRHLGKRVAFVTNNSSRQPHVVAERLAAVGVAASPEEVVTSALATADLLAARGVRRAFVVGGEGLRSALRTVGIEVVDGSVARPDTVVVGFDPDVTYAALRDASVRVARGASLIGSNPDASFPAADGENWPGAGALIAAIETATGVRAEIVGKPHAPLLRAALERAGGGEPLVVGDRIDTDIDGATRLGWASVLVLTGVSTRDDARRSDPPPTYVMDDLRGLFRGEGDGPGS
ncbi:MAG TPA: HAD-IIA family hydrolase [Actinomycetota bacterium]|nr:HAD-IIA family hydrolase [Actinomycetota bacterium]